MRHLHYRYPELESMNKRNTFIGLSAGTIGTMALMGGGAALAAGAFGDGGGDDETTQTQTTTPKWYAAPEYPEASGARSTWWNTLQDWQKTGTYGASMPDYNKVYKNAQNRINQYYWGGASGGGLIDKIRAGAARRGVSDSPAVDVLTQRMGAEQAGQLGDISTNLDVTKANAVEAARNNWMNSIMNLSNMKPAGTWGNTTTMTQPQESMIPALIGGGISLAGNQMTNQTLEKMNTQNRNWMTDMYGRPQTSQASLTANPSGENFSNLFGDMGNTMSILAMLGGV